MKGIKTGVLVFAVAAVLILSATSKISGFQDNGIGEYVNVAPLKQGNWKIPPGHFGLMASYANSFLSKAPMNGNYQVTFDFVKDDLADYYILDVRPASAYDLCHIIGAENIPLETVAEPYNLERLPTDRPILVVCGSGLLASEAASVLGMMGYQVRILKTAIGSIPTEYKEPC